VSIDLRARLLGALARLRFGLRVRPRRDADEILRIVQSMSSVDMPPPGGWDAMAHAERVQYVATTSMLAETSRHLADGER
jgi:hypothetical protein